jgi:hypothetical protein
MEKTDKEKKAEIIKAFAEALDKHTSTAHEVWCVIHALQDACEFLENKRYKYRHDLSFDIRCMREDIKEIRTQLYDDFTDDILETIMLSGANAEGLIVVNSKPMESALYAISDEFNC